MADQVIVIKKNLIRVWLITVVVLLVLIAASMQFALWVDKRSNAKWCDVVVEFGIQGQEQPPETERGKRIAIAMENLSSEFECEG